jgi:DNA-damage-inducible protein J
MATIQVRVDESTKNAADSLFTSLGLDTSTAVRMFIASAVEYRGIPFSVRQKTYPPVESNDGIYVKEDTESYEPTPELAAYLDEAIADIKAGRNLLKFKSNEDALAYFDKRINK